MVFTIFYYVFTMVHSKHMVFGNSTYYALLWFTIVYYYTYFLHWSNSGLLWVFYPNNPLLKGKYMKTSPCETFAHRKVSYLWTIWHHCWAPRHHVLVTSAMVSLVETLVLLLAVMVLRLPRSKCQLLSFLKKSSRPHFASYLRALILF